MSYINNMFNFDDYEINNIKGEPINEEENERITKILKLNNSALYLNNSILYDFLPITLHIFNDNTNIIWHKLHYDIISKPNNKHYFLFNDDQTLYINSTMSYIILKKQLFLLFKRFLFI